MCIFILPLISPIKVAFSVTTTSILIRLTAYINRSSVFPRSGIIISFSSGIIILFCYCAILTRYERKNYRNKIIITLTITCFTIIAIREKEGLTNIITANIINISPFLVIAIAVIILSMVCINKTMFTPTKSLITSY